MTKRKKTNIADHSSWSPSGAISKKSWCTERQKNPGCVVVTAGVPTNRKLENIAAGENSSETDDDMMSPNVIPPPLNPASALTVVPFL